MLEKIPHKNEINIIELTAMAIEGGYVHDIPRIEAKCPKCKRYLPMGTSGYQTSILGTTKDNNIYLTKIISGYTCSATDCNGYYLIMTEIEKEAGQRDVTTYRVLEPLGDRHIEKEELIQMGFDESFAMYYREAILAYRGNLYIPATMTLREVVTKLQKDHKDDKVISDTLEEWKEDIRKLCNIASHDLNYKELDKGLIHTAFKVVGEVIDRKAASKAEEERRKKFKKGIKNHNRAPKQQKADD